MQDPIFTSNPNLDLYYKTTDNNCFYTQTAAQNHAHTLTDKTVTTVYNQPTEPTEPVNTVTTKAKPITPKK